MLQRLDRLTEDEARITVAQTLEVVYSLFQNMRDVVDGEQVCLDLCVVLNIPIDGKTSIGHVRDTLGMFCEATMKQLSS